ncbi:MAG: LysM peptidoglycan-binding domain-containing protein [Phycisphaerae bacterium]|nr:LysM peptidoglycan-binding domain-containing protein [Phycisphaerae bacterium]
MTREAKVGLLLGLVFIVAFGMILSEIQGVDDAHAQPEAAAVVGTNYYQPNPLPQEELAMGPGQFRAVEPRYAKRKPAGRNEGIASAGATSPGGTQRPDGFTPATIRHQPTETRPADTSLDTIPTGHTPRDATPQISAVQPAPPRQRTYRVKANDSLYKIARVVYGQRNGHLFNKIYEANRDRLDDASSIRVGQVLVIPPHGTAGMAGSATVAGRPAVRELGLAGIAQHVSGRRQPVRRRVYVVQPGDNLTAIARKVYNDASSETIEKIFQANRDKLRNKNNLPKGVKLRIPG